MTLPNDEELHATFWQGVGNARDADLESTMTHRTMQGIAAVKRAVIEGLAREAENHEVRPHSYWGDMLVEQCNGTEYSVGLNIAKWLRSHSET